MRRINPPPSPPSSSFYVIALKPKMDYILKFFTFPLWLCTCSVKFKRPYHHHTFLCQIAVFQEDIWWWWLHIVFAKWLIKLKGTYYYQLGPLWRFNFLHMESRIWTSTALKFWLCWMKLFSSDSTYTKVPQLVILRKSNEAISHKNLQMF